MGYASDRDFRATVIVLGSDHVASAVAHRLHREGFAVVLIDRVDPPCTRRGMSFTDAWYYGTAALAGVGAVFCASVRSIPSVLAHGEAIAATSWSWAGVASALSPAVLVDTRPPSERLARVDAVRFPPLVMLEIVPGAVIGPGMDVAFELVPEPRGTHERSVYAPCNGRFSTLLSIGDAVRAGETIGWLGGGALAAPIDGCLRGLCARGARVGAGREVAEVDPRGEPRRCFGIERPAQAVADGVAVALSRERIAA